MRMLDLKWWWARKREHMAIAIAYLLPRWLVYRATIRMGVHATTRQYSNQVVPELYFVDALQRWEK